MMGVSHDTVSRAKRELVTAGFLVCQERYDDAGRRTTDDLFLRGARRNPAEYVRRTGADSNSNAVELDPDELEVVVHPQKLPTVALPAGLSDDERKRGAEFMRNLRLGQNP